MLEKILFGTYTKKTSQGIYQAVLDTNQGRCFDLKLAIKVSNPTYLQVTPAKQLFTVAKKENQGGIEQFSLVTLAKSLVTSSLTVGAPPCYVGFDQARNLIFTANYHTALVQIFKANGEQPMHFLSEKKFFGQGPRPEQEESHTHYADLTPDGRLAVCDLGADRVYTFTISATGTLTHQQIFATRPGFAPRHLVFHPNKKIAFLVGELSSQVAVLNYDQQTGTFEQIQQIATIPLDWKKHNGAAAIKISADGKFVYVSNRGHDSIAVFAWQNHHLALIQLAKTYGSFPRDFAIDPSGKYLLVANQESDQATLFERSTVTGKLICRQKSILVPEGVCVKFVD
jgi:6-phosphogluconolactonase